MGKPRHTQTLCGILLSAFLSKFFILEDGSRDIGITKTSMVYSNTWKNIQVFVIGEWVVSGTETALWLPLDYRPNCLAYADKVIVLGCASGRVRFMSIRECGATLQPR
jgi:hypothetical protein